MADAPTTIAQTSTGRKVTRQDVLDRVARLFTSTGNGDAPVESPGKIGIEVEWFAVRPCPGTPRPVPVEALRGMLEAAPSLIDEARITFEPGGQLEISPRPQPSLTALLEKLTSITDALESAAAAEGIALLASGLNPWHTVRELGFQTPAPRYRVMQTVFDGIGPLGRRMMRQTAALQVCLDLGGLEVAIDRWRLANLAGPALSAAFANSPLLEAAPTGMPGARTAVWLGVEPTRTGFNGSHIGDGDQRSCVQAYAEWALNALAMPLPRGADSGRPGLFRGWLETGGARPDAEDLDHHLSTLFPPVRPRGHLEIRYVDALPARWRPVPAAVLAALLYDREATVAALAALSPYHPSQSLWQLAAKQGPAAEPLRTQAAALFEIALNAFSRFPAGYMPVGIEALVAEYRDRFPTRGRCPADDQLERFRHHPEDLSTWR